MNTSYKLDFDRHGLLRSQEHQFTNKITFLKEVLQNARRAGADHIVVEHEPENLTLRIKDNGKGFSDYSAFFTSGKSGWSSDIIAQDNPYGIGVMSLFFASHFIEITSAGKYAYINTNELLEGKAVAIQDSDYNDGTEIILHLKCDYNEAVTSLFSHSHNVSYEEKVNDFLIGFPIKTSINGVTATPVFLTNDPSLIPFEYGLLKFPEQKEGVFTLSTDIGHIFSQGFRLESPALIHYSKPSNVIVFLNNVLPLRSPDRDQLFDSDNAFELLRTSIHKVAVEQLIEYKASVTPAQFSKTAYYSCYNLRRLDLLNDCPLPIDCLSLYTDVPRNTFDYEDGVLLNATDLTDTHLVDVDGAFFCLDEDVEDFTIPVYAFLKRLPILDKTLIHKDHPSLKNGINEKNFFYDIECNNHKNTVVFTTDQFEIDIVVCDSFTINSAWEVNGVKYSDELVVDDTPLFDGLTCYYPLSCNKFNDALLQVFDYLWDGIEMRGELDNDIDRFENIIRAFKSSDIPALLSEILSEIDIPISLLNDKSYNITFRGNKPIVSEIGG